MKTQFLNTKSLLKGLVLVIAILFINQGMQAQKSIKSYEVKEFTSNFFKNSDEILVAINSVKNTKAFYEEEIVLEKWMTDLDFWAESLDSSAVKKETEKAEKTNVKFKAEAEVIIEENLELEDWMLNYEWIDNENFEEEELQFEDWMKYPKNWNIYACG